MKIIVAFLCIVLTVFAHEKVFVVERENSALAVIENHKLKNEIKNLHNFNHAVVKFIENDGYVITRDGYLIKFDPIHEKKIAEVQASKSAIGFTLAKDFIAVANYANKTVEIYDRNLRHLQTIDTGSRNVGIKTYKDYLVFAAMDSDAIWVMKKIVEKIPLRCIKPDGTPMYEKKIHFEKVKIIRNAGEMPFDAMINKNLYVVGFFNSPFVGVLNLDTFEYKQVPLKLEKRTMVLKVPHFGFWSIMKDKFFIPAVGDNKVFVFDQNFHFLKAIEVEGNPVFTSLSPDRRYLAVTFSGKKFPIVQIVDTKSLQVIKRFDFGGMVLHVRWSKEEPLLYVSNNGLSKVIGMDIKNWKEAFEVAVPKPSGIFIFDMKQGNRPKEALQ
ncbi:MULTISPECIES: cytochrome D1 domain-containing protein [unclassified Nitratiruptor]|uniref:cytochrome D1 domain-containing protein n=1 Tax=unclassified Nitratiruptor TaxID=2624044 RepID=UPI0019153179|nr:MULTISPECIES: cytochrome D1 domain-containing protein [unclassified Nitratiruptor]BCD61069.1 heme d1 biosynthesis protein NirF [Nitratiruptor sp. YY08-10]BCD65002.1 heme d1 biosynthesis protein NirF [Nitratiruptor sp. YY08-14]